MSRSGWLVVMLLVAPGVTSARGPEQDAVLKRLDALYAERDQPASARMEEVALQASLRTSGQDPGISWRAARWYCWQAELASPGSNARRSAARKSWDYALLAIERAPDKVEGYYYAACGSGLWAREIGVANALIQGMEGTFNGYVETAIRLDPDFDFGGPLLVKGRYYFELPWPKRDLRRSAEMLKKALEHHPGNVRALLYLVETLVADGKVDEARAYFKRLESHTVGSYDPPEERHCLGRVAEVRGLLQGARK